MKWLKGIGLFLIANFLIYLTLSFTANLLVNTVLPAFGIDVRGVFSQQLLVWSLLIGFGGAFISLAFSKQMARAMRNLHGRAASEKHIPLAAEEGLTGEVDRHETGGAGGLHVDTRASEVEFVREPSGQVVLVVGDH